MLRIGNRIRPTGAELGNFEEITGFRPENVTSIEDLDEYVKRMKKHFGGGPEVDPVLALAPRGSQAARVRLRAALWSRLRAVSLSRASLALRR